MVLIRVWPMLLLVTTMTMFAVPAARSYDENFSVSAPDIHRPIELYDGTTILQLHFVSVAATNSQGSAPSNCQPGVQISYPKNASVGESVVITTTVTSACVPLYDQVIVNILPPNSSEILSTTPASPAVNTVTAPEADGPWHLVVQVLWNDPPTSGTFEIFQTTITIKITGTPATSTDTPTPATHYPGHSSPSNSSRE
jgi:hypothetical protein